MEHAHDQVASDRFMRRFVPLRTVRGGSLEGPEKCFIRIFVLGLSKYRANGRFLSKDSDTFNSVNRHTVVVVVVVGAL